MPKKKKEKEVNFSHVVSFLSSNFYAYLCFFVALIICFYTIYNVEDYQQKINSKWMNFISERCSCSAHYKPDVEFKLQNPVNMIVNYGKSNYNKTVYFVNGQPATAGEFFYGGLDDGNQSIN